MHVGRTEGERERRRMNLLIMGKMTADMRFFEKLTSDLKHQQWSFREEQEGDRNMIYNIQGMVFN